MQTLCDGYSYSTGNWCTNFGYGDFDNQDKAHSEQHSKVPTQGTVRSLTNFNLPKDLSQENC